MWTDRAVEAEEHALIVEKEGQAGSLIKKLRIPSLLTKDGRSSVTINEAGTVFLGYGAA